jgi:hypothetical protein
VCGVDVLQFETDVYGTATGMVATAFNVFLSYERHGPAPQFVPDSVVGDYAIAVFSLAALSMSSSASTAVAAVKTFFLGPDVVVSGGMSLSVASTRCALHLVRAPVAYVLPLMQQCSDIDPGKLFEPRGTVALGPGYDVALGAVFVMTGKAAVQQLPPITKHFTVFEDALTATGSYAAVLDCGDADCALSFFTVTLTRTLSVDGLLREPVVVITMPAGACSVAYDDRSGKLVVAFNTAFDDRHASATARGAVPLGAVMRVRQVCAIGCRDALTRSLRVPVEFMMSWPLLQPILQNVPPSVQRNIRYLKFLDDYVSERACLVDLGEDCKPLDGANADLPSQQESDAALSVEGRAKNGTTDTPTLREGCLEAKSSLLPESLRRSRIVHFVSIHLCRCVGLAYCRRLSAVFA